MLGYSIVPDPAVSLVHGIPLADEPGLGTLTLPGWLKEVTDRYGPSEAIVQPRPGGCVDRWTYDDLWQRAMDVALALVADGLGRGERVGILTTNRAEFITTMFGTALAGGVAVPLSTFSTRPELEFLLKASAVSTLVVEPSVLKKDFLAMLAELEPALLAASGAPFASAAFPFLRRVVALDRNEPFGTFETWDAFLARGKAVEPAPVEARAAAIGPADAGAIFFSSGSTGRPKGIIGSQRALAIQLWRWPRILGLRPERERCWCANGFFWSAPVGMAIGGALSSGGTLVLQSTFDPEEALRLFEAEAVTTPLGWPHQWEQLAAARNFDTVDLSAMHCVDQRNPIARHPTVDVNWQEPTRIYGSSETFTLSSAYCAGTDESILQGAHGFPLPGMTIKVVDPLGGQTLPVGERGELAVKGPTLMVGYVGVPLDETLDEEGYFRTGDGGYVDADGRVYWEGRLNDIIKTGGANVSPIEIDDILSQIGGVKFVKTVGVPDDRLGELVVACIVLHDDVLMHEDTVRQFARQHLASYKVPRRVLFLAEGDLSSTGSNKVKAGDLRKLATERLSALAEA